MIPHVDLEFLGGLAALGAIVVVSHSVVKLGYRLEKAPTGKKFYVHQTEEKSTNMGGIGNVGSWARTSRLDCTQQCDEDQSNHEIPCPDTDGNWEQHDFSVAVEQSESGQNTEDAS